MISLRQIVQHLKSSVSCYSDSPVRGVAIDIIETDPDGEISHRSNILFEFGEVLALTAPTGHKVTLVIYDEKGRTLDERRAP